MTRPQTPLRRSIGLSGLLRWIVAVAAVIAIGAAVSERRYALSAAGVTFLVAAVVLGYRARQARQRSQP